MGCGICGFVGLSDKPLLRSMCDSIKHRGPDDTGYYLDTGIGLGIDRLKIIDLATGDQPMHNEDGSIWLAFNGEIYNYLLLRSELESHGHSFYTASDTETVVHAYEEWGDDCVSHLRGMFAFAIWDKRKKRLYLARDRFGKKPLYYAMFGGILLFGSEIKAILQYADLPRELDYDAMDYFFTYMYIPSPLTIFRSVRKLPPASYAVYEKGNLSVSQYWDLHYHSNESISEDAAAELLDRHIRDAVRVRMRSDVPLGAFLSGGIDSSTVVAYMSKLSDIPVKTVSIGFDSEESEVAYSRRVAEFLQTDHREYTVTPEAYRILPKLIWHFDEPFADHSLIPTYYLSSVTRREVTVALSGDGGDEIFMGYPFLVDPRSFKYYSMVPTRLRTPTLKLLLHLPAGDRLKKMAHHALEKNYGRQSYAERYAMRMSLQDRAGLRKFYSEHLQSAHTPIDTYRYMLDLASRSRTDDVLHTVDYATTHSYLEEDILVKVDRMSMAVSLEVRCPLLDHELAGIIEVIPSRLKLNGGVTKYIFKKMVTSKGLLPKDIAYRRKQGFGAPIQSWMQKEWKDIVSQVLDPLLSKNAIDLFDREEVKRMIANPNLYSNKTFALIVFMLWYRLYVEEARQRLPVNVPLG